MYEQILTIIVQSFIPFLIGGGGVWLYYRNKFTEVLTELEDKKVIIKTIYNHADDLERENVKIQSKKHNETVSKKTATEKPKKEKNSLKTKKTDNKK